MRRFPQPSASISPHSCPRVQKKTTKKNKENETFGCKKQATTKNHRRLIGFSRVRLNSERVPKGEPEGNNQSRRGVPRPILEGFSLPSSTAAAPSSVGKIVLGTQGKIKWKTKGQGSAWKRSPAQLASSDIPNGPCTSTGAPKEVQGVSLGPRVWPRAETGGSSGTDRVPIRSSEGGQGQNSGPRVGLRATADGSTRLALASSGIPYGRYTYEAP